MTAPFDSPGSRWFSIPAHRPFVDDLAAVLLDSLHAAGPETLSDAIVLTPTRRGARALAEAFVKASGGRAVLLPQIRAVGDLDEGEPPFEPGAIALDLPPAVSGLRRRFELARLVKANEKAVRRELDGPAALEMADALAGFLDSLTIEERLADADVDALAAGDLAKHWAISAEVLAIVLKQWPRRLEEMNLIDPAERRVRLSRLLGEQWRERPPGVPLIAAGSTGTAPATADLLAAVAAAPRGCVVLPGLDLDLAESAWDAIAGDEGEQHPQGAMKRLLDCHGLTRADVMEWPMREPAPAAVAGRARRRVINEALRPASATADWRDVIGVLQRETLVGGVDPVRQGLEGLRLVSARTEEETAGVAALLMREALEVPGRTCALITPDQALARRVSARLSRWGVEADSSAGSPLAGFPAGVLLDLLAQLACDPAAPVVLLGLLKSPLVRLGMDAAEMAAARDAFERHALRGPRRDGWASLYRLLERAREPRDGEARPDAHLAEIDRAEAFARRVEALVKPLCEFFGDEQRSAAEAARLLAETAEALARDGGGDVADLWSGPDGECAARLLAGLIEEGEALPPVTAKGFHKVLERLLRDETVRPGGATHPRLRILGAIEARLVRADVVILAGLEEGVWPGGAPVDPFLSRPMRKRLGLPPPERKVGLAAHDFAQAACAPEVYLLHSERRGGQPAVKSRWLWRLETLADGAGAELPGRPELLDWVRALDAAPEEVPDSLRPAPRPAPKPPAEARPTEYFVTQVETLTRDPYAVYARKVLGLNQLERPDAPVDARIRGTAIHSAMEGFTLAWDTLPPEERPAAFADRYLDALREAGAPETDLARERPLARRAGAWIAGFEAERRAREPEILVERKLTLPVEGLNIRLSAKADRIEIENGRAHVLDFKTGAAPTLAQVRTGFSPQLTLTAALIARGALGEKAEPGELVYVRVSGREPPGEALVRGRPGKHIGKGEAHPPSEVLVERAWEGFVALAHRTAQPGWPFRARTAPQHIKYRSDYDHLARTAEWSTGDEEGAE